MILQKIVTAKKSELDEVMRITPESVLDTKVQNISCRKPHHSFRQRICRQKNEPLKVIAEIKKASPSKGIIRKDFDYMQIARIYADLNVDAISVLTEKQFFMGSLEYLKEIHQLIRIPLLRKDFIISAYQIKEAYLAGASAVLLIASILSEDELSEYICLCDSLELDYIVEVHTEEELKKALSVNASVIGINNRDLKTFTVDIHTTEEFLQKIPESTVVVSESGVHTPDDVRYLNDLNVDAVLIGEALMKEPDIKDKFRTLFSGIRSIP